MKLKTSATVSGLLAASLMLGGALAAAGDLDRDRFLDRNRDEVDHRARARDLLPEQPHWGWDLYASGNRYESDSSSENAFSYELTAQSPSKAWTFALTGDLYKKVRNDDGSSDSGFGDTTAKATWKKGDRTRGFSLTGAVSVPTGADGITADRTDEYLRARVWTPAGKWTSKFDLRASHIGGDIAAGVGEFKYDGRARFEREFDKLGQLGLEASHAVREGKRATTTLGIDLTKTIGSADWTFALSKGIASTNDDIYFELGADFTFGD